MIEEQYIEPWFSAQDFGSFEDNFSEFRSGDTENIELLVNKLIYEEFRKKYEDAQSEKIDIRFIPQGLREIIESSYLPLVEVFLYDEVIFSKIRDIKILLYQNTADTRGRMRSGNIHMYWVPHLSDGEFLSVLIHEFAHYYDIYTLAWNAFWDVSEEFYDISWESATQMKAGQEIKNFVSGYAATNQYEDFAESYTYYVLHNEIFYEKSKNNSYLREKYNFFARFPFASEEFSGVNFWSETQKSGDYLWDTTKLEIDVKKFLQYLSDVI